MDGRPNYGIINTGARIADGKLDNKIADGKLDNKIADGKLDNGIFYIEVAMKF